MKNKKKKEEKENEKKWFLSIFLKYIYRISQTFASINQSNKI